MQLIETIDGKKIRQLLSVVKDKIFVGQKSIDDRDLDVFFADGYGDSSNRSVLFCLKGSPNVAHGYIEHYNYGLKLTANGKSFYFNAKLKKCTAGSTYADE